MPFNLLAYAYNDNAYGASNVEDTLNQIQSYIGSYKPGTDNFKVFTDELVSIKDKVERREKHFYNSLGVNDYYGLVKKLDSIENKYACMLAGGAIIREIKRKYSFKNLVKATDDELRDAVEEIINDFLDSEFLKDQGAFLETFNIALNGTSGKNKDRDAIHKYLQKMFTTESNKRFITERAGSKVGLGKIITSYNPQNRKISVDVEGMKLSSGFRRKLEEDLTQLFQKNNPEAGKQIDVFSLTKEQYRDIVNSLICRYLGLTSIPVNQSQYDLNRSIASTIGYLGEIRATLILQELDPQGRVRGTGNLRTASKGQEIPIDVVCEANGFQIKNYTLESNEVTFSNRLSSVAWIRDRMQLTGELSEVLIALFGIYQYNQPITDEKKGDAKGVDYYRSFLYDRIADGDDSLLYQLKEVYDSRIPQMLKIADQFSVSGDSFFGRETVYFNSFFWINKHLVPASWILDKIIKGFKPEDEGIIRSQYNFSTPLKNKMRYQIYSKEHRETGSVPFSIEDAARKIKAEYNITIDLSEFANMKF